MFALRETLLLCTIFFCLSSAKRPKEGQRCEAEGRTGVCVAWDKCAPIAEMFRSHVLQDSQIDYVQKFNCGYRRNIPYYCCVEGISAPPSQNQDSPIPTNPTENMERNVLMNHRNRKLIPLETCGQTEHKYIAGGEEATLGEFPWLALIHYKHKRRPAYFHCGGALINKRYVLTVADCLHQQNINGFYPDMVRLGEHNLETDPDIELGQEARFIDFMIEKIIIHEDYDALGPNHHHDIALIRLGGEAPETRYVKPICLPTPEVEKEILSSDDYLEIAGWGKTEAGARSSVLMKVAIPVGDFNTCAKKYANFGRNLTVTQLCAGMKGKDACQGDGGNPLMGLEKYSNYKNMRWFAVGLVSYGHAKCGAEGYPGVYTRVLPYIGWILDHMEP